MSGLKLWAICLAIWMLATGLLSISNFQFEASHLILGVLAILVGILLLLDK